MSNNVVIFKFSGSDHFFHQIAFTMSTVIYGDERLPVIE